eukprot:5767174-Prymnesium_polylepis.1
MRAQLCCRAASAFAASTWYFFDLVWFSNAARDLKRFLVYGQTRLSSTAGSAGAAPRPAAAL